MTSCNELNEYGQLPVCEVFIFEEELSLLLGRLPAWEIWIVWLLSTKGVLLNLCSLIYYLNSGNADLNKTDKEGFTALYRAAAGMPQIISVFEYFVSGGHPSTMLWIIGKTRRTIDRAAKNSSTPLHAASQAFVHAVASNSSSQIQNCGEVIEALIRSKVGCFDLQSVMK